VASSKHDALTLAGPCIRVNATPVTKPDAPAGRLLRPFGHPDGRDAGEVVVHRATRRGITPSRGLDAHAMFDIDGLDESLRLIPIHETDLVPHRWTFPKQ